MADAYVGLILLADRVDPEWREWAHHAADRSIQLGPTIAAAHSALGAVRLIVDWDGNGAGAAFDEALRCNPFNYAAYQRRRLLRTIQGRFSEARVDLRKAVELKPEHFDGQVIWAWSEFCGKDFDQAIRVLHQLPPWPGKRRQALRVLTTAHGMKRDFAAARKTLTEAKLWSADEVAMRAWLDARQGNATAAQTGLNQLRAICEKEGIEYCETAVIEAELERVDQAFASLEQGLAMRHWKMLALAVDPRLESLHEDPRWGAIMARVRPLQGL
jgi:tetratricopeptide (TPR) repeat protein